MPRERARILISEFLGSTFLLVGVVGSGVMAERLSPDDVGLQLLQNAIATAAVLVAIISIFGSTSADFNPVVTIGAWLLGHRPGCEVAPLIVVQFVGACVGTVVANVMFELQWVEFSERTRSGGHLWLSEIVATFGLLLVVFSLLRTQRKPVLPWVVGAYIGGAYYFTSSTGFANPAVTLGRTLSNTFAGIKPTSAPMFVLMQVLGLGLAVGAIRFVFPATHENRDHTRGLEA